MNRSIDENPHLQLQENTIESLTQAGSLGAEYVEFGDIKVLIVIDVQLTKDNVPVLYHDCNFFLFLKIKF
jgi:glycerophosphoryl diester phosphodiesterase